MRAQLDQLAERLDTLRETGEYRNFVYLDRRVGGAPRVRVNDDGDERSLVVWCSNDYLGLSQDSRVLDALCSSVQRHGAGSGGTRNIAGSSVAIQRAEARIARFHGKEHALVFSSGYVANSATLAAISSAVKDTLVLSDEKNHASMIEGIRLGRADKYIFRHNDLDDLRNALVSAGTDRPKLIAIESVYSMDGDKAPLADICQLSADYNALLYVNEVHAVGLYGERGSGVTEEAGVAKHVDIIQGTLGKAAGLMGGYIASSRLLVDYVRSFGGGFIFTTALPPSIMDAACVSLDLIEKSTSFRDHIMVLANELRSRLHSDGFEVVGRDTHILPILFPGATHCRTMAMRLAQEYGIYVQPINFPTVPRGTERLRITVHPSHNRDDAASLISAMVNIRHSLRGSK